MEKAMQFAKKSWQFLLTPIGAYLGTFAVLVIFGPVLASIRYGLSPASTYLRYIILFAILSLMPCAYRWTKTEVANQIKPSWLSWSGICLLVLQAVVCLILLVVIGLNWIGVLHPTASLAYQYSLQVFGWSCFGLLAVFWIWKNSAWGYFLEVGLIVLTHFAPDVYPAKHTQASGQSLFFNYSVELTLVMHLLGKGFAAIDFRNLWRPLKSR